MLDYSSQHKHWPTLIDKCAGSFEFPNRMLRDSANSSMSLSMDVVAKESCPKFNPRPGQGLNPGAWLAVGDLVNCVNLALIYYLPENCAEQDCSLTSQFVS